MAAGPAGDGAGPSAPPPYNVATMVAPPPLVRRYSRSSGSFSAPSPYPPPIAMGYASMAPPQDVVPTSSTTELVTTAVVVEISPPATLRQPTYALDCSNFCPDCYPVDPGDTRSCRVRSRLQCDTCKYCFCTRGAMYTSQKCCGWLFCAPICCLIDLTLMLIVLALFLAIVFAVLNQGG